MKKKLSLVLAILMMLTMVAASFAEEETAVAEGPTETELLAEACNYTLIEADETTGQARLSYIEGVTPILEIDGLKFKDLDKDGELDIYEDWRLTDDERVADLISKMSYVEKIGGLLCINADLEEARYVIEEFKMTCLLFNLNGTPVTITNTLNNLQAKAEAQRLGIPMIFTSDREYNAFGGYIDKAHIAFGTANDPQLAYDLAYYYGQAMQAIGVHVTFEPYANEIGAQYGENPEHIANIVYQEVKGLEDSGFASCIKHWIGRGGDSNFGGARSVAQNFDNWMVGWKAALAGGAEWVMTNCGGSGITNTVDVKFDSVTMNYLRETLGFKGVVVSDWWPFSSVDANTGVTPEGEVLSEKSYAWLVNRALELGTDMFGTPRVSHGDEEDWKQNTMTHHPDVMVAGLEDGTIKEEYVDRALTRIYQFSMKKDLFEDPYCNTDEAVALTASAEWAANPTAIHTNEDLRAARNPYEVELTEKLQAESAVLMKNDNDVLPLAKGTKIYIESSSNDTLEHYKQYLAEYGTVVDAIADADVVIGYYSAINDAAEVMIEDAQDAGKPIVLTLTSKATEYALVNGDAVIYMPFSQQPDHGTGEAGFIYGTEPWVYADLLFGEREPAGIIQKEQARNDTEDALQWKDLAGDQGASSYVRLIVQALMMADTENHSAPNNYGDPLVIYEYSMHYGEHGDFAYSCLILPQAVTEEEVTNSRGSTSIASVVKEETTAGEPFSVYCLLNNNGADDITTVQVKANGEVVAEKLYTVQGGSWRVVEIEVTLDAGEYEIEVGGLTGTLIVK